MFTRRRSGTPSQPRVHDCHSVAAFASEDVDDARRATPAGTLDAWAASRGLEAVAPAIAGHVYPLLPPWPQYLANMTRGAIAPDRWGVVAHELYQLPVSEGRSGRHLTMGGRFHGERLGTPPGSFKRLLPGAELLGVGDHADEPFGDRHAAWAPVTGVWMSLPEAALLPRMTVRSADRLRSSGNPLLTEHGLPGYRIRGDEHDQETVGRVLDGAVGAVLRELDLPFVELRILLGQVALRRNGFLLDHAELDRFVAAAVRLAGGLVAVAGAGAPGAWETPLGPPPPRAETGLLGISDRWDETLDAAAEQFALVREDPTALHRAFPRLPVPGRARGVLRGTLPGGVAGRFTVHQHEVGSTSVRAALLLPLPPGHEQLPPGGVFHAPTDMYLGAADGVLAVWRRARDGGALTITDTVERGMRTAHELGYA